MDQTHVRVTCVSKKEIQNYDPKNPKCTEVELQVPYDQNSIFHKMSGGTNTTLRTVNQEAADMFEIGKEYTMIITPHEVIEAETKTEIDSSMQDI